MAYVDLDFYRDEFLAGDTQVIPDASFIRREREASAYVDTATSGRIWEMKEIPIEVMYAVCEIAELYYTEAQKRRLGRKRSESVGSYSVSYDDREMEQAEFEANKRAVLIKWLADTGLLYRGVK